MKVLNLPALAKKGSMSQSAKPKSTKRRDDSFETCLDIVPYEGSLPLLIFVPVGALLHASLKLPLQGHSWMLLFLARPMAARERHLHQLHLPLLSGEYVISKLYLFFLLLIHGAFLLLTPHVYSFISLLFLKKNLFIYLFIFYYYYYLQSKYKEDTSATCPILFNEPELEVHSFPSNAFSLPRVAMYFFPFSFFACLFISSFYLNIYLPSFSSSFFFRLISSPLYTKFL